jgi:hypothetical protein
MCQLGEYMEGDLDRFIVRLTDRTTSSQKFKIVKKSSSFILQNVLEYIFCDTAAIFREFLKNCIDRTIAECVIASIDVKRIGIVISSGMLQDDVVIPIRPVFLNDFESILLEICRQLSTCECDALGSLWQTTLNPFKVDVTIIGM